MTESTIAQNIAKLRERIRIASQKNQRDPASICLLAVSKTQPAELIRQAAEAGVGNIGENYLQEALDKMALLADLPLCWHFIGPLQSNKTRAVAEHFDWVHSVDREKIARRLSQQRPAGLAPLNVCLQVNISKEDSKAGADPADLEELARTVSGLPGLRLRGLMAIPALTADASQQRANFSTLRNALQKLQALHPELDTLSMGMSADLDAAIAEGSTLLRIGTAVFGPRGG